MKAFADIAQIKVKAGNGGNGVVSFRREKYIPKGGPDGGDGGRGGSIYIEASHQLNTLYDFTHQHKIEAVSGANGSGNNSSGKSGSDITMTVPIGTVIYELVNGDTNDQFLKKVGDLTVDQQRILIAKGGKGGRGNTHFKSSTNQAPDYAESGTLGDERMLVLELKSVADVGLIGLPNVGKSTLLTCLTKAKPQIANYPFTTLAPNLGIMEYYDHRLVLADLPGLIEGASEGKGLGDEFLRHVERTKILVHVIDPMYQDPLESYEIIRKELKAYSEKMMEKSEIVVINKIDVTEVKENFTKYQKEFKKKYKLNILGISAATGEGLKELKKAMYDTWKKVKDVPQELPEREEVAEFTLEDLKHY